MDHARGFRRQQRRRLDRVPVDHDRPRDRQKRDSSDQSEAIVTFDRRRFIRFLALSSGIAGAGLLQACAPSTPNAPATAVPASAPAANTPAAVQKPAATTAGGRTVQLPNRFPLTNIKPDLPPSDDGLIDAAFVNYPANPPKTVPETPGGGGEVSVVTWTTSAVPTPMESNALWQAVNKELGIDLKINIQPQADYA